MKTFKQFLEETAEFDYNGVPKCPDCGISLDYESAGNRDIETMGGYEVEYFACEKCGSKYELINKELFPHGTQY